MTFTDIIFLIGVLLIIVSMYSVVSLLRLSIKKTKEELRDLNVANLWVLFIVCLPLGLFFIFFWF